MSNFNPGNLRRREFAAAQRAADKRREALRYQERSPEALRKAIARLDRMAVGRLP